MKINQKPIGWVHPPEAKYLSPIAKKILAAIPVGKTHCVNAHKIKKLTACKQPWREINQLFEMGLIKKESIKKPESRTPAGCYWRDEG